MNVKFTLNKFPVNQEVKDASGSLWGCVIQPFKNQSVYQENAKNIDRCKKCFAYINNYCKFERGGWCCNLCLNLNQINLGGPWDENENDDDIQDINNNTTMTYEEKQQLKQEMYAQKYRYSPNSNNINNNNNRDTLPELTNSSIELLVDDNDEIPNSIPFSMIPLINNPIYIAVVDYSGNQIEHDVITSGLEALVHALPSNALFGLITFSTRIGIYNLNTSTPLVKFIESSSNFNFSDILPIDKFLVNKGKNENNIIKAIQSIPLINETVSKKLKSDKLNDTLKLLVQYLSVEIFKMNVKVGLFLTETQVNNEFTSLEELSNSQGKPEFFKATTNIYKKIAERSIDIGVHFDIFAVGEKYFGFDSLRFLCCLTGGQLFRYNKLLPTCTLPQDIYKLVSVGWGFHGLIRVRTSSQFSIDNSYGSIVPSKQYENLYHIESTNPFSSIAFDFKFNNSNDHFQEDKPPMIQIVFSYSYLPPIGFDQQQQLQSSSSSSPTLLSNSSSNLLKNSGNGNGDGRIIQKRLHIVNVCLPIANSPLELFQSIDLETSISLLTQRVIRDTIEKGITESRVMLVDWLKNVITKYNENVVLVLSNVATSIDVNFSQVSHLRPLPRYVFALLKSMLLRELTTDIEAMTIKRKSDEWIYIQLLYSNLEPRLLHRSIYPVLYSYGAPNNLASKYLPLSTNTILTSTSNIYLIDSFDHLLVFYNIENDTSPKTSPQHQFPPPPESLIRQTISNSKQDRLQVPDIKYLKGKLIDNPEFSNYLIDEDNNAGVSYNTFLKSIATDVKGRISN